MLYACLLVTLWRWDHCLVIIINIIFWKGIPHVIYGGPECPRRGGISSFYGAYMGRRSELGQKQSEVQF